MKKLLLIAFLFISLVSNCQQVSELTKGLVFHWKGDEWGNNRDEVSGISGTATATYPVLSRDGSGRRSLSFNGSSDYVALPTIPAFGTGDFTVIVKFKITSTSTNSWLIGGNGDAFGLYVSGSDLKVRAFKFGVGATIASTYALSLNTDYVCSYTRSGTTGTLYINSVSNNTGTDSNNYTGLSESTMYAGYYAAYGSGSISLVRIFNYALTPTQIANYSRPEYAIEWVDRGATGAELITATADRDFSSDTGWWTKEAGISIADGVAHFTAVADAKGVYHNPVFTVGKNAIVTFTVKNYTSGGLRLADAVTGTVRTANGTYSEKFTAALAYLTISALGTTTADLDDVSAKQAGCILDLNAEGVGRQNISTRSNGYWWDAVNNVAATVSGATVVIPPASNLSATFFNGTTSNVAFTGISPVLGATDRTYSAWVNRQATTSLQMIIFSGNNGATGGSYMYIYQDKFTIGNNSANAGYSTTALSLNTWYHLVVVLRSGLTTYYVDGVKDGTGSITMNTLSGNTYIGKYHDGSYLFNGIIWNCALYNYAVSDETVKLLYDLGR